MRYCKFLVETNIKAIHLHYKLHLTLYQRLSLLLFANVFCRRVSDLYVKIKSLGHVIKALKECLNEA